MADDQAKSTSEEMPSGGWYIVKQPSGECAIVSAESVTAPDTSAEAQWGPFDAETDAIARRVGLIRAGKCRPA